MKKQFPTIPMKIKKIYLILFIFLSTPIFPILAETDPIMLFNEAESLYKNGRYGDCMKKYEILSNYKDFPKRKIILLRLGEIYLKLKNLDGLLKISKLGIKEFPKDPYPHAGLAAYWAMRAQKSTNYFYKLKDASNALDEANRAIKLKRDCSLALFIKGIIFFHYPRIMGKLEEAASYFKAVLTSLDKYRREVLLDSYYYLALSLRRLRRTEEAITVLKKGLILFPNSIPMRKLYRKYGGMKNYITIDKFCN